MTTAVEIPLQATPQTLQVSLSGTTYTLTVRWCDPAQAWFVDVADALGNDLADGLMMVTGADLLEQLGYLGFQGQFIVQTDHNADAVPTFANLGGTGHLYYVTEP